MFKKITPGIALLIIFTVILAACGGEKVDVNSADAFDVNESHEVIFLNMYANKEESINLRYLDHLRKKFPHWTFTYKTRSSSIGHVDYVTEVVVTGEKFDIIMDPINDHYVIANNGLEFDMTDLVKKHNVDLSRVDDSMMAEVKLASNGEIHGLPIMTERVMLFHNKELFDKFGVPYPKDGMTWDEAIELSKRMDRNEDGVQYLGLSNYAHHLLLENQLSIPIVDDKTDKPLINTDPRWKRFIETIWLLPAQQDGYKAEMARLQREPHYGNFYTTKNLAMYVYISSLPFSTPSMQEFNWDVTTLPTFSELPGVGAQGSPSYMGIVKVSENKDAAMVAMKHLLSDEVQTANSRQGLMTVLKNDAIKKEFALDSSFTGKNWAAMYKDKYAPKPTKTIYDGVALATYVKYSRLIQRGELDINTALRQAEEEAIQAIEQAKAKTQ